jgi:hypothetical protein
MIFVTAQRWRRDDPAFAGTLGDGCPHGRHGVEEPRLGRICGGRLNAGLRGQAQETVRAVPQGQNAVREGHEVDPAQQPLRAGVVVGADGEDLQQGAGLGHGGCLPWWCGLVGWSVLALAVGGAAGEDPARRPRDALAVGGVRHGLVCGACRFYLLDHGEVPGAENLGVVRRPAVLEVVSLARSPVGWAEQTAGLPCRARQTGMVR